MAESHSQDELDQLVRVRTGLDTASAQMLKNMLGSHGVPAFLSAENMSSLNFAVTTDLLVREGDRLRAENLLHNVSAIPPRAQSQTQPQFQSAPATEDEFACPHCGSNHVQDYVGEIPSFWRRKFGLKLMNVSFKDGYGHCHECGSYFSKTPRKFRSFPVALKWAFVMGGVTYGLLWFIDLLIWL